MKEKLVTIVTLPYSKAHILKSRLAAMNIECELEDLNFIEGSPSISVKVMIMEKNVSKAMQEVEDFLGHKPVVEIKRSELFERHILVPVDFSPSSEKACKLAFSLAKYLDLKLVIMHCYINPLIHSVPFSDIYAFDSGLLAKMEFTEKNANEQLKAFLTKISTQIGKEKWETVPSEVIIKSGYADEDILAYVNNNHSQMIVMGSGGKLSAPATVGSITVDILYNARVPVFIIPEDAPDIEIADISKVVYATNFDDKDFLAVDKLMSLLYPFKVKIYCVHVGQQNGNEWDRARIEGMKDILHEKFRDQEFECRLLEGEDISEALETFIRDENVDIISLTTHKRNMISRLFNPSLARKMVYHTNLPLLVFHA